MLVNLYTFVGSDDDGHFANYFGSAAERDSVIDEAAREAWDDDGDGDYPEGVSPEFAWSIVAMRRGETYGAETVAMEVKPVVPRKEVAAARAAVEALRFARDCLKVAEAHRARRRVVDALSSAKGAVRNAEMKEVRLREFEVAAKKHDAAMAEAHAERVADFRNLRAEGKI